MDTSRPTPDLLARAPQGRLILLIAAAASSSSGTVLVLAALGWITLPAAIVVMAPATAIALVALFALAGPGQQALLLERLRGGLVAGIAGLAAYDVIRLLIFASGLVPFNPFRPIETFGLLILDRFDEGLLTRAIGWAFHLWNGIAFAQMYTLTVGRGRPWWAVGWGLLLELAMLATYPSLFRLVYDWAFVTVSLTGHLAYGLAIGVVARRVIRW